MPQSHDIEDVLSSIRRLVAADTGTSDRSPAPAAERPGPITLVLEEMHRVTEPEDPFQMIQDLEETGAGLGDAESSDAVPGDIDGSDWTAPSEISASAPETDDGAGFTTRRGPPRQAASEGPEAYAEDADFEALTSGGAPHDASPPSDKVKPPQSATGFPPETSASPTTDFTAEDTLDAVSAAIEGDEALRGLIAEIVRQELSGELGERITRNVRKIIRREIRQALASEDLD